MNFINNIDVAISEWIQSNLRFGLLDGIMKFITNLGDIYFFILVAVILYWLYDKKFAYKFFFAFLGSALVNSLAKVFVKRDRPFVSKDNQVVSVGTETHGYSFPSGHSQASGVIFFTLNDEFGKKNKIVKTILYIYLILVPFSRIYLGQHYFTDVLVGSLIGIGMSILMYKLFESMKNKEHIYPLYAIPVILVISLVLMNGNYSNYKDLFVAAGGYIGFASGYTLEKLYIKHNVDTTLKNKLLKLVIGLVGVAIVYFGLSALFDFIAVDVLILDLIRYMIVGLFAAVGVPYLFTIIFKDGKDLQQD